MSFHDPGQSQNISLFFFLRQCRDAYRRTKSQRFKRIGEFGYWISLNHFLLCMQGARFHNDYPPVCLFTPGSTTSVVHSEGPWLSQVRPPYIHLPELPEQLALQGHKAPCLEEPLAQKNRSRALVQPWDTSSEAVPKVLQQDHLSPEVDTQQGCCANVKHGCWNCSVL